MRFFIRRQLQKGSPHDKNMVNSFLSEVFMTEKKERRDIVIGCLCAFGAEALFGMSYVFTKQATVIL